MEQKFGKNSIDIEALREFCEREGKEVTYRKGDQLEREGDPARWFYLVLVRGRVCDRLSQLSRRSSSSDYDQGDDAQPHAPCERRTTDGLFPSRR